MVTQQQTKISITGLDKVLEQIAPKYLGFNDLYDLVGSLANSQGFYSRLFRELQELDNEQRQELDNTIKQQKFTDSLDLIFWLEG